LKWIVPEQPQKGGFNQCPSLAEMPTSISATASAWVRIKKARGSGYYLEAVTLEESIIADRLVSFLVCVNEIEPEAQIENRSFGQLIQLWTKRAREPIPVRHFPDLRSAVEEWRKHRNRVVHGMVKSMPGAEHCYVLDFLKEAEFVAFQGEYLAHEVSEWVRKAKRQFIKTIEAPAVALE
jgi:hypothetical protein